MSKLMRPKSFLVAVAVAGSLLSLSACADNDNARTTATTVVPPPRRQTVAVVEVPMRAVPTETTTELVGVVIENRPGVDRSKPLLVLLLQNSKTFLFGELVILDFSLLNAKLKGHGGEYRVRYFVDYDDPRWIDNLK